MGEIYCDNTHDKNLVLADRFRINLDKNIINGSLTTNFQKASSGEKIEVSAQPVGGYELDTIIVTNELTGEVLTLRNFDFIMPRAMRKFSLHLIK